MILRSISKIKNTAQRHLLISNADTSNGMSGSRSTTTMVVNEEDDSTSSMNLPQPSSNIPFAAANIQLSESDFEFIQTEFVEHFFDNDGAKDRCSKGLIEKLLSQE